MAKPKEKAKPKLELNRVLKNLDAKNKNFYDELDEEERKGFSPFLMLRYTSAVDSAGMAGLDEYVLRATNKWVNPNFFDLKAHPKLQWQLLTTTVPGFGPMRHSWIKPLGNKKTSNDRLREFLIEEFPSISNQELDIMTAINSKEELIDYATSTGLQDKEIGRFS
jgi:hypothetical protein